MNPHYRHIRLAALVLLLVCSWLAPSFSPARAAGRQPSTGRQPSAGRQAEKITINFVDVEISSIVRIMSDITGRNFIFDEGLRGKVTIVAPAKLTSDEALGLFAAALELKNYTILPTDNALKIVPLAVARQSGARVLTGPGAVGPEESFIVRLVPLKFISVQEAFSFVQPFVSRFGQISVFGSRNALLVVDTAANAAKIIEIIDSVDQAPDVEAPDIVYLSHARAEVVSQVLKAEAARVGMTAGGAKTASKETIIADLRLNAIILSGAKHEREYLKRFIRLIDIPPPEASSRINVYYLENADAEDLAKVLDALTRPPAVAGAPGQSPAVQELRGRVSITPEKSSNALIIMASPGDYKALVGVIEKLDRRPRQVFVEAMITEVTIDKALELGAKWRITAEKGGEPVFIGGVGSVDSTAIQSVVNGLAGLTLGGLGNFITVPVTAADGTTFNLTAPGFAALFSLKEFKDAINVLSTPHLLTSDNSEAEIVVGQNVPFLSQIERGATTAGQPLLQSIERKDVGIKLRIKPKISEGNFVKLNIYQEISAIAPTTTAGASDLITTKRSAKTTVVVKDNQTVVIGGLIQTRRTNNDTRVPLLGSIPLLGWLFRFNKDQTEKTNVLVFITPHIIGSFQDLDRVRSRKVGEFEREAGKKGMVPPRGMAPPGDGPPTEAPGKGGADE
ncbi:MAG: type II secretion system secretin GspD [Thermodesulfobacteriota bacterium]